MASPVPLLSAHLGGITAPQVLGSPCADPEEPWDTWPVAMCSAHFSLRGLALPGMEFWGCFWAGWPVCMATPLGGLAAPALTCPPVAPCCPCW